MKNTKHILAAALGAALSVTALTSATPFTANARSFAEGGKHTAKDATAILKDVVGIQKLTGADRDAADLDGDGYITAKDATYVLKIVAGLLDEPTESGEIVDPTTSDDSNDSTDSNTSSDTDNSTAINVPEDKNCSHDFDTSTVSAKCETAGSKTYTCKKCGYSYTETISPLSHNYKTTTVNGLRMVPKTETWYLVNYYNAYNASNPLLQNANDLGIETYYPEYGPEPHNEINENNVNGGRLLKDGRLFILTGQYWTNSPTLGWNGTGEQIYNLTEDGAAKAADKYCVSKGLPAYSYGSWTDVQECIKTEIRPVPNEYELIPENKTKTVCTRCKHNPDETEHTHTYVLTNGVYNGNATYICECGDHFTKIVNTKYPPNNVTGPNDPKFTTHTHVYTRTDWDWDYETNEQLIVYTCECGDRFERRWTDLMTNEERIKYDVDNVETPQKYWSDWDNLPAADGWVPDNCTIVSNKIVANS